jgi:hypothetical protein
MNVKMKLKVTGISSQKVKELQNGGLDENHQTPLIEIAHGQGNPCRHCLNLIAEGDEMLILSYRPFKEQQPYAETGPIFLHKESCKLYDRDQLPKWFVNLQPALVRGYDENHWICYETAEVVSGQDLTKTCVNILNNEKVSYVHIRSKFNCFQCKVERV